MYMTLKQDVEDLAIFGSSPVFIEKLHVGRPNIGNSDSFIKRARGVLASKYLTNHGPLVQEFEKKIASHVGVKNCVAMCNGTMALEIAIRALGLKGEVILPSLTFVATPHALQWQEITPVFCDVDAKRYMLDPTCVEKKITARTSGIIGVHLWGRPCDVEALTMIAKSNNLKLVFDASHAFGCSLKEKMIGGFGDAEVLSFHATKFFNTFEGGAVVTDDDDLADRIRLMQNFGFSGYDNVVHIGTNGKMSEICAAMGLTNLESVQRFVEVNHRNFRTYDKELKDVRGINLLSFDEEEKCNYQYIVIEVDKELTGISRDHIVDVLHAENVLARRYFYPGCHNMEPYRSSFPNSHLFLPNTERIVKKVVSLPTGTNIKEEDIVYICQIIKFVVENSCEVLEALKKKKRP